MTTENTAEVETAEEEQESNVAEEEPEEELEDSAPKSPSNEFKVVIMLRENKVMMGVQAPECDPVYTTFEGDLKAALKRAPKLVDEAKGKWTSNPRNPKADLPTPPPSSTPARTPAAPKSKAAQPSFF